MFLRGLKMFSSVLKTFFCCLETLFCCLETFTRGLKIYLSFNVDKLSNANNTAMITKRNTIFGSFQPDI